MTDVVDRPASSAPTSPGDDPAVVVAPGTHRAPSRGQFPEGRAAVTESSSTAGRFGRMFRNLPAHSATVEQLDALAETMAGDQTGSDSRLPSGVTYFGQFVDHDLTFDTASNLQRQNDPDALVNFRTPAFDLDCVYGRGPADQPYLYDGDRMLLGRAAPQRPAGGAAGDGAGAGPGGGSLVSEDDLPRNAAERALIGDPRNDENIIVSQLQLAFLKLHNRLLDDLAGGSGPIAAARWRTGTDFEEAQRLARWHYQWLLLNWFLPRICDECALATVRDAATGRVLDRNWYRPRESPYIPVEWSVGAYRFGHSMVRGRYHLNPALRRLTGGNAIPIFIEEPPNDRNRLSHLAGGRQLPAFWTLDFRMFFDPDHADLQRARAIDTHLAGGLSTLPGATDGMRQLARLNLRRGLAMGLPSGQAVARRLGQPPLDTSAFLDGEAPLWFYVLKEAETRATDAGSKLGVVGSTIVAETLVGLLAADPFSYVRTEPGWTPAIPARGGDQRAFDMLDLLAYAVPQDGRHLPGA